MRCKQNDCYRKAYTSGFCTTHYRRRHNGQPMNAPIKRYVRLEEQGGRIRKPATTRTGSRKRERPFAAEWALLKELGLVD